jgi:hypothetical protein
MNRKDKNRVNNLVAAAIGSHKKINACGKYMPRIRKAAKLIVVKEHRRAINAFDEAMNLVACYDQVAAFNSSHSKGKRKSTLSYLLSIAHGEEYFNLCVNAKMSDIAVQELIITCLDIDTNLTKRLNDMINSNIYVLGDASLRILTEIWSRAILTLVAETVTAARANPDLNLHLEVDDEEEEWDDEEGDDEGEGEMSDEDEDELSDAEWNARAISIMRKAWAKGDCVKFSHPKLARVAKTYADLLEAARSGADLEGILNSMSTEVFSALVNYIEALDGDELSTGCDSDFKRKHMDYVLNYVKLRANPNPEPTEAEPDTRTPNITVDEIIEKLKSHTGFNLRTDCFANQILEVAVKLGYVPADVADVLDHSSTASMIYAKLGLDENGKPVDYEASARARAYDEEVAVYASNDTYELFKLLRSTAAAYDQNGMSKLLTDIEAKRNGACAELRSLVNMLGYGVDDGNLAHMFTQHFGMLPYPTPDFAEAKTWLNRLIKAEDRNAAIIKAAECITLPELYTVLTMFADAKPNLFKRAYTYATSQGAQSALSKHNWREAFYLAEFAKLRYINLPMFKASAIVVPTSEELSTMPVTELDKWISDNYKDLSKPQLVYILNGLSHGAVCDYGHHVHDLMNAAGNAVSWDMERNQVEQLTSWLDKRFI